MMFRLAIAALLFPSAAHADELFIGAGEAKALLGKPDVVFVCSEPEKNCAAESIAGSVFAYSHDLQFLDDVKACKGLPMCEPHAAAVFGALGIDGNTRVIAYDAGIGVNASGTWFLLRLYGHDKVQILDGGLATWKKSGGAVSKGPSAKATPKTFVPKVRTEMIATVDEVKRATADPANYLIVDARHNLDEYIGKTLQVSMKAPGKEVTVPRGGHIPNAVFSPWTKYAGNKSGEPDKPTLRDAPDLKKQLDKLKKNGYAAEKTVISYCHVGIGRGSFQYMALQRAGHQKVKVYVGSWSEWGSDQSLPLAEQP
jgi:thiosulfate/3-mercaptopyruvate sulfurtransferase